MNAIFIAAIALFGAVFGAVFGALVSWGMYEGRTEVHMVVIGAVIFWVVGMYEAVSFVYRKTE